VRAGPGDRVTRREDEPLLRGAARYLADLPGVPLHAVFVRATRASAVITAIETASAAAMPGVVAVARSGELGLPVDGPIPGMVPGVRRPLLAAGRVRHVGEPLAVVVAETLAAAVDAAERVVVDLDPMPVVVTPRAAVAPGAPLVHAERASNVYLTGRFPNEPPDGARLDVLADAEVVEGFLDQGGREREAGAVVEGILRVAQSRVQTLACLNRVRPNTGSHRPCIPEEFLRPIEVIAAHRLAGRLGIGHEARPANPLPRPPFINRPIPTAVPPAHGQLKTGQRGKLTF